MSSLCLSYDPLKAIFTWLPTSQRVALSKNGGILATADRNAPIIISKLELTDNSIAINDLELASNTWENRFDYKSPRGEMSVQMEQKNYEKWDKCVEKMTSWVWSKPRLHINAWKLLGVPEMDSTKCRPFISVKQLEAGNIDDFTQILPLLAHLEELHIKSSSEPTALPILLDPVVNRSKTLRLKFEIMYGREPILELMKKSNNCHLHIDATWNNWRCLLEFVQQWMRKFRPIGSTFRTAIWDFIHLVDLIENILEDIPNSFRSRNPAMDEMDFFAKGVTIPLDEDRELMIYSGLYSRNIIDTYYFVMEVASKGHAVRLPVC